MTDFLLTRLREAQKRHGYLSEDILKDISRETGMPISKIYGVTTFYSMLHIEPQGKNIIYICNSPPCHVNGSFNLLRFLEKELGVKEGQVTEDGLFSFHIHSCIGCCDKAPAMLMNGRAYDNLTEDRLKEIIKKCRSSGKQE